MPVIISSDGNTLESRPSLRFGRSPYFIQFNHADNAWKAFENPASQKSGGAGVATSQFIIDKNVKTVLSGSFGPNAFQVLSSAAIRMFSFDDSYETIQDVIKAYKNGSLKEVGSKDLNQ